MSCLPNTPIAPNLLSATNSTDLGWIDLTSVSTSALSQYYPLSGTVMTFEGTASTTNQHMILQQLEVEETAATSGDIKKAPLHVYLYTNSSPGTPTLGAVYNGSTTNLIAVIAVAQADYVRISDTKWVARVNPSKYYRTGIGSTAGYLYGVVISNNGASLTYAAGVAMRVKVITEAGTAQ
jgi:hypothetical protein